MFQKLHYMIQMLNVENWIMHVRIVTKQNYFNDTRLPELQIINHSFRLLISCSQASCLI